MCLIDEVVNWSPAEIRCRAASHRLSSNPLRTVDGLRSECGIEYAAQAIAIHGALIAARRGAPVAAGMLASVRRVALRVSRLDDIVADLMVRATHISGDATAQLYDFSIAGELQTLLTGRATIVLRQPSVTRASAGSHT